MLRGIKLARGHESYLIKINKDKCVQCGECVDACPCDVFEFKDTGPEATKPQNCWFCETCLGVCEHDAITITEVGFVDDYSKVLIVDF